ncbi:MAG: MMPL family transporter, partial [Solirubrobacteraceae bacterium]
YVTGTTAATIDFQNTVSSRLPIIIAVVVVAAFLLLLASFRSPVLALKAALLNLLSIAAAYGVVVAVFQWGWGSSLLGVSGTVPIESYVPMIIFAIVFGLSMDYEVFLISRIREHWLAGAGNRASVALGLSQTARVISCAALIMASVFFAFLLSSSVVVKMLALGLGASVILDATVIRLLIVPSLMFVFDAANWWTPAWLDRVLPRLEPAPVPAVVTAAAGEPRATAPAVQDSAGVA